MTANRWVIVVFAIAALKVCGSELTPKNEPRPPQVFLLDGGQMAKTRESIRRGDKSFAPALEELQRQAATALRAGPYSVVDDIDPASGDKHDYMSQAPY